jgi:hypothetical protein
VTADDRDFPELRAAVRESILGAATLRMLAAVRVAWSEAVVTRSIASRVDAARRTSPALLVRSLGVAMTAAALGAWAMSLAIPTYLGTSIPAWAFLFGALVSALAVAWPETFANQWSRSGLRRFSLWLRSS